MYQQREKLQQIGIVSLCIAILFGLFGLFKSFNLFIYLALFFTSFSIVSEAIVLHLTFRKMEAIKIFIPGVLLFALTIYLFFNFLKGS